MSIRLRLAVVFAIAAAILFTLGSWLFVAKLSASLLGTIDAQLTAQLARAGRYAPPSTGAAHRSLAPGSPARPSLARASLADGAGSPLPGEYVVQVIDPAGRVRGGSRDAGTTPMLGAAELSQARTQRIVLTTSGEGERERLMAAPLPQHRGWVAVAGVSLEGFNGTRSDVTRQLIIGGIVFVAAAGLGGYGLARAALSPVERMRRQVASVSARHPAPGIQVPRTRDEIAALATTMNELLGRLQAALSQQRALVADASHELRTPFAVLRGELELTAGPVGAGTSSRPRSGMPVRRSTGWRASPNSCSSWPKATRTRSHRGSPAPASLSCSPAALSMPPGAPAQPVSPATWTHRPAWPPSSTRTASGRPSTTSSITHCGLRPPARPSCYPPARTARICSSQWKTTAPDSRSNSCRRPSSVLPAPLIPGGRAAREELAWDWPS